MLIFNIPPICKKPVIIFSGQHASVGNSPWSDTFVQRVFNYDKWVHEDDTVFDSDITNVEDYCYINLQGMMDDEYHDGIYINFAVDDISKYKKLCVYASCIGEGEYFDEYNMSVGVIRYPLEVNAFAELKKETIPLLQCDNFWETETSPEPLTKIDVDVSGLNGSVRVGFGIFGNRPRGIHYKLFLGKVFLL